MPDVPLIGVVADSQVTTTNGFRCPGLREKKVDKAVETAIRPPGVELLAPKMLEFFLNQLTNVQVILYLGDGANSGCADELQQVLDTLRRRRGDAPGGVPIFYVTGNHDYLGIGTTTDPLKRQLLCGPGNSLSKYEVIDRIRAFNQENTNIFKERISDYVDSFGSLSPAFKDCQLAHQMGCFYAARFLYGGVKGGAPVEFFLTDTSDYKDIVLRPEVTLSPYKGEQYGVRGSMSFDGPRSQVVWFKQFTNAVPWRVVASHYPPKDFKAKWQAILGLPIGAPVGRPGDLVQQSGQECRTHKTVWLSGHTHEATTAYTQVFKDARKGRIICDAINVGSTIDYPLTATLAFMGSNGFCCEAVPAKVRFEFRERIVGELKKACVPDYGPVFGHTNGLALFGLNKDYQRKNWTEADTMAAQANVGRFLSPRPAREQVDAAAVLVEVGAAEEHKQGWKWFHRGWLFVSGMFGL